MRVHTQIQLSTIGDRQQFVAALDTKKKVSRQPADELWQSILLDVFSGGGGGGGGETAEDTDNDVNVEGESAARRSGKDLFEESATAKLSTEHNDYSTGPDLILRVAVGHNDDPSIQKQLFADHKRQRM
jgi:hypothetical protein